MTYTNSRIIHQVDLRELYPNVTLDQEFDLLLAKTRASHNFKGKFNFVFENEKIYFLTTIPDPSILKLNVYLNSTLAPNENLKKVSRVCSIILLTCNQKNNNKKQHIFFVNSLCAPSVTKVFALYFVFRYSKSKDISKSEFTFLR